MNAFKDYLITEYKDKAQWFVATEFKFNYSTNIKFDKTTNKHLKIDIIKVTLKLFDKDLNQLHTASISFENNVIPKTKAKQLINISPKELENKVGFAKHEICNEIYKELKEKLDEIQLKLDNLSQYSGIKSIIPNEFKGEIINVLDTQEEQKPKDTQKFEM